MNATAEAPSIEFTRASRWYGPVIALNDVSVKLGPGVTGLLGPNSNAHGPNEFLHIEKGKKLTCCVAQVLEDHMTR